MQKITLPERPHWRDTAKEVGFTFADMHGEPYWDETSAYRFTLRQIEDDIEDPSTDLHAMCRDAVAEIVTSEQMMDRLGIRPVSLPRYPAAPLALATLASALVTAVQVGALEVSHSVAVLRFYAHFSADFDALCQTLVHVLRDDALHAGRAWAVCATILDALRQSCAAYLRDGDERNEAHFVALARQLANATMLRGPGFAVAHAIDADAMRTFHVAGAQQVLAWHAAPPHKGHVATFFRGLAQLLGTVSPAGAMQMYVAPTDPATPHCSSALRPRTSTPPQTHVRGTRTLRTKSGS